MLVKLKGSFTLQLFHGLQWENNSTNKEVDTEEVDTEKMKSVRFKSLEPLDRISSLKNTNNVRIFLIFELLNNLIFIIRIKVLLNKIMTIKIMMRC
jgi:hypothetical protein